MLIFISSSPLSPYPLFLTRLVTVTHIAPIPLCGDPRISTFISMQF